jgi:hypothetical protein
MSTSTHRKPRGRSKLEIAEEIVDGLKLQGFDRTRIGEPEDRWSSYPIYPRCSQCEALCVNGIACHEIGCPNIRRDRDDDAEDDL